ncbi:MAG TPA: signal peptidase I [Micromonosporaceae bacterium]|jgi:signal peptidase I
MQKRQDLPVWKESLIIIGVVFFLAVLVRTFLFQAYYIPSSSMSTTIQVGDRVLVNKTTYDFRGPQRGEVVVFRGTTAWPSENTSDGNASMFSQLGSGLGNLIGISQPGQDEFVKRVIGLPGDQVACCDSSGRVLVNGAGVDEPYITPSMNAPIADSPPSTPTCADRNFRPIVVPAGMMFVMGDRRLVSQDSRCNGMIPISNIVGRAVAIIWPSSHWTTFSVPKSFKSIPAPEAAGPARRVPIDAGAADGVLVFPLLSAFGLTARSRGKWRVKRRTLRA